MKLIRFIFAIFLICSLANAKAISYSESFGGIKCRVKVNPVKGLVQTNRCVVQRIDFFDSDKMWLGTIEKTYEGFMHYKGERFYGVSYIDEVAYIEAVFDDPRETGELVSLEEYHNNERINDKGQRCERRSGYFAGCGNGYGNFCTIEICGGVWSIIN